MCLWLLAACLGVAVAPQPQYYNPQFYRTQYYPSIVAGGPVNTIPPASTTPPPTSPTTTPTRPTIPGSTQQPFPLIDPRLQTPPPRDTEALSRFGGGDYQDVVIETGIMDGAVNFPRSRRQAGCACYLPAQCGTPANTNGVGLIDFRIVNMLNSTCTSGLTFCCLPTNSGQQSCGSRVAATTSYPIQGGQARYGDYPWMVVIMTTNNQYVGGGVLLDLQNVLTTAHRISSYTNGNGLKIRLGEWDAAGNYEQYPFRDFAISRVWTHESFNPGTLQNDIALIRLVSGVPAGTPGVVPICLPSAGQSFEGQRCWVSGWGKNAFGVSGQYQSILKAVDVPVIASSTCETSLRTTRLGTAFLLDRSSFLCAGGEANKDACTGDGGSGLVCETSSGRWTLAGLVAWGIGCATQGVPAAYVNIVSYLPWITTRQSS